MEIFVAVLIVLVSWCVWRVRSILRMLEDTRDDDRYGHS